ncbi:probable multidrug resistance-associated protein lethal(2)03659 [Diabrotica virgifera virgifera]|uniref:Multidrug resistance-associated protein lethal(2)03659 n=1 Tax=Diabrotica virgifera virgifera TaxID=50390 RepID=A0ABM5INB8_DIAVI|nr:probable multidrug resistance-associated protein lethal(2)03659 [Diabrotica virgifera virgifera]XP_028137192.2 probable multidrug resistance-associated protein lethal(2)03659 [Diabrotica virgifera virgifera]XP_028137193.2 probable multidrug resistance-associated protein lethal(2)03659 [Diabrotica virgifera virgifera]
MVNKIMEKPKEKFNPLSKVNIFSYLTFGYVLELIKKGWKHDLNESDLYGLPKKCKSKFNGERAVKQWNKNPSLFKLLLSKFGLAYLLFCLAHVTWVEIRSIVRPYGMSKLIAYFDKKQQTISETQAFYCASLVIFIKFFSVFYTANINVFELKYLLRLKTSLQSLLYEKLLKLSSNSILETSSGNLITVMTKDIYSIETNLWVFKEFVIFFVQTTTVFYLLYSRIGVTAFVAVGMFAVALPVQGFLCKLVTKLRLTVGKHSDERLQITQEALTAIRVIKMYTWERFFIGKISKERSKELSALLKMFFVHFLIVIIGIFLSGIVFLALILTYTALGYDTNTELIFYIDSLFGELTLAMGIMIPINMSRTAELIASLKRINKVFQCQEISKIEKIYKDALIDINNVSVEIKNQKVLDDVSLKISKPGLHVITGVVGSGKSSIFKVIIGLHNLSEGYCKLGGTISFAAQEPWLFPSSIKNNILFGEKYDKARYEEVLKICGLDYDLAFMQNGDETIVAEAGLNLSKGQQARVNLARCIYKDSDIYLLDDPLTALDANVQDVIFEQCILKFLKEKICILISQNPKHIENAENIFTLSHGKLVGDTNIIPAPTPDIGEEQKEPVQVSEAKKQSEAAKSSHEDDQYTNDDLFAEKNNTGKVGADVYKSYMRFGGGICFVVFIILLYTGSQVAHFTSEKLKAKWVDVQANDGSTMLPILGGPYKKQDLLLFTTFTTVFSSLYNLVTLYSLLRFCRNASYNVHKLMVSRITTAVMTFFDTNYLGNVVNRFSYDLNILDERLPMMFLHLFRAAFYCLGILVLIATVNWVFLFPSIIFISLVVTLRILYINTGRNLKRLEAATRSPLVGHINATLDGLSTIRAFDAEKRLTNEFYRHQDLYSSAVFTMRLSHTALIFYMGALSATFSTIIMAKFLFFPDDTSAGNVGLALTNIIRLSDMILWGINEWIEIETNMTSVERCLEYTKVKQEDDSGKTPKDWPTEGGVIYKQVELKYGDNKIPVLKNINFTIKPKHNIGIVGRTGAGKSSIISTLFRLYEYGGNIEIDGVDIKTISLSCLRKNIAIIPQDPILFSGTLRENIDPYKEHADDKIWSLLNQLSIENIQTLDSTVANFSAGQKQLICMARAALNNCRIIVLDEITANMDTENDNLIHSLVEKIFKNCTILTIAHRLNFILSCDMVIVMENGQIVEFDEPKTLLENEKSLFAKICDKASS